MVKGEDFRVGPSEFKSQLHHLLCLHFQICKMGTIRNLPGRGVVIDLMHVKLSVLFSKWGHPGFLVP